MNRLQKHYRDSKQIDFSIGFKSMSIEDQEELNLIHRIQVHSARCILNFNDNDYRLMLSCIDQYQSTYGAYELEHFTKEKEQMPPIKIEAIYSNDGSKINEF